MNNFRITVNRNLPALAAMVLTCLMLASCDSTEIATTSDNSETEPTTDVPTETPTETPVPGNPVDPGQPVGDCTVTPESADTDGSPLNIALTELRDHLDGSAELTNAQIEDVTARLNANAAQLTNSQSLIEQAFATIDRYDEVYGPLFLNDSTAGSISRASSDASDAIHYAMIALQQSVIDHAYSNRNVRRYQSTLNDRGFATADFFPGPVPDNSTTTAPYIVTVNASNNPSPAHRPYGAFTADSRRPTGAYAAPGAIVAVSVPESMVGSGFSVRVGAHSWDLSNKNSITRLDRVSLTFDVLCSTTLVSNPLGGGIYIEVPFEADAGAVNVQIDNAVRAPFYAARSFTDHTSADAWQLEQTGAAPWADLESDHFMIQVPATWLVEIEDPAQLMQSWDAAMQSILNLYGVTDTHKTMLYVQVDRTFRGSANFPGYPMSNYPYNPATPNPNNNARAFLRGPDAVDYVTFHELGHQLLFTKFRGEVESVVHLPYVNFMNTVFNLDLNTAFSQSSFRNPNVDLDQAFMNWAVRPNFQQGLEMRTARPNSEKLYQRRGYAHYVVIAELFGWEALERFWASEHADFAAGIDYDRNSNGPGDVDSRILRMSRAAGIDLRPLLHVWGNHPEDADALSAAIQTENLPASAKIYDELQHYTTLIPMDNEAFATHARTMYPLLQSNSNTEAFEGWYHETAQTWSSSDGATSLQALQNIIDLYFPNGRPADTQPAQARPETTAPDFAPATTPPSQLVIEDTIDPDHHTAP